MNRKLFNGLIILCFILFSAVLVFSNQFDWDHFISFFEVEYRSWIFDHQPPLWSYQACAGVTRIGDPQAFGLSPLFLFVLLFGSFWGSKILVLFCSIVGFYALTQTLRLLFPLKVKSQIHSALSLFFILSGYYLWHFYTGQLTFALSLFIFLPLYYALQIIIEGYSRRSAIKFTVSCFVYFTAGFYHSLVFFVIPLAISFLLIGILFLYLNRKRRSFYSKNIFILVGLVLLSLLAASYKWLGVMKYQKEFPRTLLATPVYESAISLWEIIKFHMLPTWEYQFIPKWNFESSYSIWEYSAFSALPWLCLFLYIYVFIYRKTFSLPSKKYFIPSALGVLFIVPILFLIGDESPLSLHSIFNNILYQNSVRVTGRYLILIQFPIMFFILYIVSHSEKIQTKFEKVVIPFGFVLTIFNLLSFLMIVDISSVQNMSEIADGRMNEIAFTTLRKVGSKPFEVPFEAGESYMYSKLREGKIVTNCYQPLKRERKISTEKILDPNIILSESNTFPLVESSSNEACSKSVYVDQNHIHFDQTACNEKLCLNLNMINPIESKRWIFNTDSQRYCLN